MNLVIKMQKKDVVNVQEMQNLFQVTLSATFGVNRVAVRLAI